MIFLASQSYVHLAIGFWHKENLFSLKKNISKEIILKMFLHRIKI